MSQTVRIRSFNWSSLVHDLNSSLVPVQHVVAVLVYLAMVFVPQLIHSTASVCELENKQRLRYL